MAVKAKKSAGGAKGSAGSAVQEKILAPDVESLIAAVLHELPGSAVKRKHNANFMVRERLFCFTRPSALVMKLPQARIEQLVETGEVTRLRMGQRVMREWCVAEYPSIAEARKGMGLLREAMQFVAALENEAKGRRSGA